MPASAVAARVAVACLSVATAALPAAAQEGTPRRGGAIVVAFENESATLDPALASTPRDQTLVRALHDGLLAPDGEGVAPALAEAHETSGDGLLHRFALRPGVAFHSGREATAEDVVFTLNRLAAPETGSPAAPLLSAIEGYDAVASGAADSLSGVSAPDGSTVEIRLSRRDARLPMTLASSWASIVNEDAVRLHSFDFGANPDGTGPYRLVNWRPGEGLTLQRDFGHWRDGAPLLDQIRIEFGQTPETALERLLRGEIDVLGDGAPQARMAEVMEEDLPHERVARGPLTVTGFLAMDMSAPPFDDLRVRRAVGLAIDRERIGAILGEAAEPVAALGRDAAAPPPDRDAARALLEEAGLGDGAGVTLLATNAETARPVARAIQSDLAAIGLSVTLREAAEGALAEQAAAADIVWVGVEAQPLDTSDPSALYAAALACDAAMNWSRFCDPALDARAREADAAEGGERDAAWAAILDDALAQAPVAPVLRQRRVTVLSDRVGGAPSDLAAPLHAPLDYGRVYSRDVQ